jgi:demethoxyubiquinone hydroxylase (CLK1/Coq7/Cat5 family)
MKIHQLLSSDLAIALTNEEHRFVEQHDRTVKISNLDDHDQRTAQNLVRKGVYEISNDNNTLIKNSHASDN